MMYIMIYINNLYQAKLGTGLVQDNSKTSRGWFLSYPQVTLLRQLAGDL